MRQHFFAWEAFVQHIFGKQLLCLKIPGPLCCAWLCASRFLDPSAWLLRRQTLHLRPTTLGLMQHCYDARARQEPTDHPSFANPPFAIQQGDYHLVETMAGVDLKDLSPEQATSGGSKEKNLNSVALTELSYEEGLLEVSARSIAMARLRG